MAIFKSVAAQAVGMCMIWMQTATPGCDAWRLLNETQQYPHQKEKKCVTVSLRLI